MELGRREVMICSICQKLYSDGGDYLAYTYRKKTSYLTRLRHIYICLFRGKGYLCLPAQTGTSKTIKACGQMHYSVLIYTYVDTRKESAKDESREKI